MSGESAYIASTENKYETSSILHSISKKSPILRDLKPYFNVQSEGALLWFFKVCDDKSGV